MANVKEYKQEIMSIFGEIYDEIFKNRLTYEISNSLKDEFKKYKNKHDEDLTKILREEISDIKKLTLTLQSEITNQENKIVERLNTSEQAKLMKEFIDSNTTCNANCERQIIELKDLIVQTIEQANVKLEKDFLNLKNDITLELGKEITNIIPILKNDKLSSQLRLTKLIVLVSLAINIGLFAYLLLK